MGIKPPIGRFNCELIQVNSQLNTVRCPGDTIYFMGFGYEDFIEQLIELAGIQQPEDWKPYESWSPY